jgi:hypothetical protein
MTSLSSGFNSQQLELEKEIKAVNCLLFSTYLVISKDVEHICKTAINKVDDFTVDKHSRWLGFVQGILFSQGLLDLEMTRDETRPLFQKIYKKHNITQESISAKEKTMKNKNRKNN